MTDSHWYWRKPPNTSRELFTLRVPQRQPGDATIAIAPRRWAEHHPGLE
jgi:hypothetical protein